MLYLINDNMKFTYFNMLSYEIIEKIWTTNQTTAALTIQKYFRNKITYLCQEISQHINMFIYYNISPYHYLWKHDFNILVNKKIYNEKNIFTCFSACQCCSRHVIDKPKSIECYKESKQPSNFQVLHECKCLCRHITRQMCRTRKTPTGSLLWTDV
jgi:hypothetical protein